MMRSLYRKVKNGCKYCDHPAWCPSKKIDAENACRQCLKATTKLKQKKHINQFN